MVVQQLPQMPPPTINFIATPHEWVSGRGEPGATVKVHVHGVVIRDVGVDGAGNWALGLPRELNDGEWIHVYQEGANGRPNSGTISTSVVKTLMFFPVTILN